MYPSMNASWDFMTLTPEHWERYSRQLALPEIGARGQEKLNTARVLIVGVGGLGAPASLYLAGAGVGTLGLIDADVVDRSNLQRQILYRDADQGVAKVEAAKKTLHAFNPTTKIITYQERLTRDNASAIIANYDIVLDGTDNLATRSVLAQTCVTQKKPMVFASVYGFEGQISVFKTPDGPCYHCLFPAPTDTKESPTELPHCGELGVVGPVPGTLALMQANEVIRLIVDGTSALLGTLLTVDMRGMYFDRIKITKNSDCSFCQSSLSAESENESGSNESWITVEELLRLRTSHTLLDIRSTQEIAIDPLTLPHEAIPLDALPSQTRMLPRQTETYILICQRGFRSRRAIAVLQAKGFKDVRVLAGGWSALKQALHPTSDE